MHTLLLTTKIEEDDSRRTNVPKCTGERVPTNEVHSIQTEKEIKHSVVVDRGEGRRMHKCVRHFRYAITQTFNIKRNETFNKISN